MSFTSPPKKGQLRNCTYKPTKYRSGSCVSYIFLGQESATGPGIGTGKSLTGYRYGGTLFNKAF